MTVKNDTLMDDLTPDEIHEAAKQAREKLASMISEEVPPDCPVVYNHKIVAMKLNGQWWMMVYGTEPAVSQAAITLMPFSHFFHATNDVIKSMAVLEGEDATVSFLAQHGVDLTEFLSDEDHPATDKSQLN